MKKFTAFWTNFWQSALSDLQNRQSLHQWFFEVKELFFMWNPTGFNPVLESRTGLVGFSVFFGSFDNMPPVGVFWVMCRWSGWWGWLVTSFVRPIGIPEKGTVRIMVMTLQTSPCLTKLAYSPTAWSRMNRETIYGRNATFTRWRYTVSCVHWYQWWRNWFYIAIEWESVTNE